jgi:ABC-type Fe3+ transport system permease subunit
VLFLLAIAYPTVALIARAIGQGEPPRDGFTFSPRQLLLFWRSIWLSGVATLACLVVSLPGAYVVGRARRLTFHPLIAASLMAVMLCPPMVYAFGWERLLPSTFNVYVRCIGVWALWAWPIPALLIGAGWSRAGRAAHDAAILVTSPTVAFVRVILPVLLRHICLSALVVFVLFFSDFGVPHSCGLIVYATELLGRAASSSRMIDTLWPASLSIVITALALVAMFSFWRRCAFDGELDATSPASHRAPPIVSLTAILCFAVSWLLPVGVLVVKLGSTATMTDALDTYSGHLGWSLGVAIVAGFAVIAMGVGVQAPRSFRTLVLVWAIAFGALPGALIGESLVAAYNLDRLWWLYDHWPIVALCYVSRFGWIGLLAGMLIMESSGRDLVAQARTDGATGPAVWRYIRLPMSWPAVLCVTGIVAAMSVSDVAASSPVRVPGFSPIAHIIIEKFHRFEDGMLVSLSLWLVAASLPCVAFLIVALRRSDTD